MMKAKIVDTNSEKKKSFVIHKDVFVRNGQYGHIKVVKNESQYTYYGNAVIVKEVQTDIDTCEKVLVLKFIDCSGEEMEITMSRRELTDTKILELGAYGVQVNKNSVVTLIKCIENSEAKAKVSYRHSKLGFDIFKRTPIFKCHKGIGVKSKYIGEFAIEPQGSRKQWINMVEKHVLGTPMEVIFALALSAVMIDYVCEEIPMENLLVSLTGTSTTGKTTALMFAVSLGACPSFSENSFLMSFIDSELSILKRIPSSFPVGIDETSLLQKNSTKILYAIANGKERGRLNKNLSMMEIKDFHTVVFLSGEESILESADKNAGLNVRVIEFFNTVWTSSADSAEYIKKTCLKNYGWIVPEFAEYLLRIDKKDLVKRCLEEAEDFLTECKRDSDNALVGRLSKKIGVVLATAGLAEKALGIRINVEYIKKFFLDNLSLNSEEMDIGIEAYQELISYLIEHPDLFGGAPRFEKDVNIIYFKEGCLKKCEPVELYDGTFSDRVLYISQSAFFRFLKKVGFKNSRVVLRRMKELGLLISEKDRQISKFKLGTEDTITRGYRIRIPTMEKEELMENQERKKKWKPASMDKDDLEIEWDEEEL